MRIELDTVADGVYGTTGAEAGAVITRDYDVTFEVVTEHGPAGGNPIIAFEGEEQALRSMITEHYGADTLEVVFA